MGNKGRTYKNFLGGYDHYDEHGNKVGTTYKNFIGGYTHYDKNGKKIGKSYENFIGGYTHYDKNGNKIGKSYENFIGGYNHYDKNGNKKGKSFENFLGGYDTYDNQGCYIATAVYGSYDCKEVWVLRRYRDYVLYESVIGRIFIKIYYFISPKIVKVFGKKQWFNKFWKSFLDKKVQKLKDKGFEDSPYNDKF